MELKIFPLLKKLAMEHEGTRGRFKLAAGVVYKKHLIATGINGYKSHPMMAKYGKNSESIFLHAEVDAIKNALRLLPVSQLSKCDLYVVRVKKDGSFGMACPCEGCQRAIETFNLRNVYYTKGDEKCSM